MTDMSNWTDVERFEYAKAIGKLRHGKAPTYDEVRKMPPTVQEAIYNLLILFTETAIASGAE